MELVMEHDWVYQVLSDRDWSDRRRIQTSASVNSICLLKSALDIAFNEEGKQILPVPARISGQIEALNELLKSCGWIALPEGDTSLPHQYSLMAGQGVPERGISGGSAPGRVQTDLSFS